MNSPVLFRLAVATAMILATASTASAWDPLAVRDDPLVRMPGTQPDQGANLESPNRCLNCHSGFNSATEPGSQWMGSMMSQSARDPIWWASVAVAAQDSIWALSNPNGTDICLRCHMPEGWLGGRSDPTNATLMTGSDFDGVHCDVCHRMWDPFFAETHAGTRESDDWEGYWDEAGNTGPGDTGLSQTEADKTLDEDWLLSADISLFDGSPFFNGANDPEVTSPRFDTYNESASAQYFISPNSQKRASFADADARHQMLYSRFHKSRYFCGTCHDISNPAFANLGESGLDGPLPTEQQSAYEYFHVERTFSEFMLSAYGQQGGAETNQEFRDQGAPDIVNAAKCQDCHMRDVVGTAANKRGAVLRPDDSIEHPNSGLPLHDMTGGNSWISYILASLDPNGPVYDPVNVAILDKGPAVLTMDLDAGQSPKANGAALRAGSDRAKQQLLLAATIKDAVDGTRDAVHYESATGVVSFRIQNNAGHKLITGFPEGRRMWVNIKAYDTGGTLIYEVNPYDATAGTLKGLGSGGTLTSSEDYVDALVYETHMSASNVGSGPSFHFLLNDGRVKDNRIPPKGFKIADATGRMSEPVNPATHVSDVNYFTDLEYAGGYDDQSYTVPLALAGVVARIEVTLYYQGTSREYIEFLRDEIKGTANSLPAGAYVIQNDPFFGQLKAWGDTIWDLWQHNHGLDGSGVAVPGIVPFAMAEAAWGTTSEPPPSACDTPATPTGLVATGAKRRMELSWSAVSPDPTGYAVYYDQGGKVQYVGETLSTSLTDTGLKPGTEYCYVVKAWNDCDGGQTGALDDPPDELSGVSNTACAAPTRK